MLNMKIKINKTDLDRITTAITYAINKLKSDKKVPNIEIDKFQQLYDRLLPDRPTKTEEPVDYDKVGEVYGSSKGKCRECND